MKKIIYILTFIIVITSCRKVETLESNSKSYLTTHYNLENTKSLKIDDKFYNNMDFMIKSLDESKSYTNEESMIKYSAILAENGYSIDAINQRGSDFDFEEIYNSENYSESFKNFAHEFEFIITSMNSYDDFVAQMGSDSKLISLVNLITDQNEIELAKNTLFATDLLFQYKSQSTSSQANQRPKIDWKCVGLVGMGTLTGCTFGPAGCFLGMGFGALSCD
jgi:hypothetical protein